MAKSWLRTERTPLLALLVVVILTGLVRMGLLDTPLERDEGEYAYAGQLLLEGVPPYQEMFNMKLPGIYAAYAVCLTLFGETTTGIHAALLLINALTVVGLYLLARRFLEPIGAVTAAAAFAVLSSMPAVQGVSANAEHFVLLFAVIGLWLFLWALDADHPGGLFAAGLLLGMGSIMKQHGLAFVAVAGLHLVVLAAAERPRRWRPAARRLLVLAGGVATVFAVLALLLAAAGVFGSFWFWTVEYASTYVSGVPLGEAAGNLRRGFTPLLVAAPLVWVLVLAGLAVLPRGAAARRGRSFLTILGLFSLLATSAGLYFRAHYFVLMLPWSALIVGLATDAIVRSPVGMRWPRPARAMAILLAVVCLAQPIVGQREFLFGMDPLQRSRFLYGLNPFPESQRVGEFIRERSEPGDRIAILGSEPQILFHADRRSASGYVYMYPMMEKHDFAERMQREFVSDVEKAEPRFVVFVNAPTSWLREPDSGRTLFTWMDEYLSAEDLQMVASVELRPWSNAYHLGEDVLWPLPSKNYIVVFERDRGPDRPY